MPDAPIFIKRLELTAFRAYLAPATFDFNKKKCLGILGPNRHGKTSLIDGLEFIVSDDGTLDRLGNRTAQTKAGPVALAHAGAEAANLKPEVSIELVQAGQVSKASRPASGAKRPLPAEVGALKACFVVDPIIRGYALRTFVEEQTPEARYATVASWLDLGPLVEVQKNLRALRTAVKAEADDTKPVERLNATLKRTTGNLVATWDVAAVCAYINTSHLTPLDKALTMAAVCVSDPAYVTVLDRVAAEEKQVGLAAQKQMKGAADKVRRAQDGVGGAPTGAIPDFESAVALSQTAADNEQTERDKAKDSIFKAVWEAAAPLFSGAQSPEQCPVCETPIGKSSAGSASEIHKHLTANLASLATYAGAKSEKDKTDEILQKAKSGLEVRLDTLTGLLDGQQPALAQALKDYRDAVVAWTSGPVPASAAVIGQVVTLQTELQATITDIEARQGDHTYAKAKLKIDALIELGKEFRHATLVAAELGKLSDLLTAETAIVSAAIRVKVQALLDRVQQPMNEIFGLIQGAGALPVGLELPNEDDTNQQRLALVVDFAENRLGVQPSGYFSDSQIHSVALALRLAAILVFNIKAPIVILDDIVTSYDVDHRRATVQLLAKKFAGHQIIIATHDERFFLFLKEMLPDRDWRFTRITGLDPAFGPRFADHKITDEMIKARWNNGEPAANEMRQAEEEFLLNLARDFGVQVRIRHLERPYKYDRSELATAVASYLKSAGITPPVIPGVNNRFLNTLQKGEVENFGSHFSDDPGAFPSLGDEKTRWTEFKAFRDQFACPKCKGKRFQRPAQLAKPLCAAEKCETQFNFPPAPPSAGKAAGA